MRLRCPERYPRDLPVVILLSLASSPVYAYLDPGTGSLLLQGLIAAVAGVIMLVRSPRQTIKNLLHRLVSRLGRKSDSK